MTEPDLVSRIRLGDPKGFSELVDRYSGDLYGLAYSLLGNASDAEDVVQQSLIGALRGIDSFQGRSSLKTWLFTIVANQASKTRRAGRVRKATSLESTGDVADTSVRGSGKGASHRSSHAVRVDSQLDAMTMLDTLAPDHREVIVLRELQQMSYEEIAEALSIPRGTVESRLFRARQCLREKFSTYEV